jgi:CHASE3 domain sensor protein
MTRSNLKKQIQAKLTVLEQALEKIRDTQIEMDEDAWDSDYYSELLENLSQARQLLAEEENGLLTLLAEWESESAEEETDD